jgi:2-amino-4-hydroxy-6-hydroxymethyldihydropteridine diphosphokinase
MPLVAIALGSNLGDRLSHLEYAVGRLSELLSGLTVSTLHETDPVDAEGPRFLNGAAMGETSRSPKEVLDALLEIEQARGRERAYRNAPRTLDLDLVLYGNGIVNEPGLEVPHPRFRERRFVLAPLAEIAPEMKDPVTGLTVRELLGNLRSGDRAIG